MARSPGRPEEKRRLLAALDEKSLPYLIADVLALNYGHREVRVVDGPGDGRRDIHSLTPARERCVTQCKFHRDANQSVSARETDELPLALTKFGATHGFFATTGRLSPQAAREYLDNFPDFKLGFFGGTDLADEVLSSPYLRAAWLDDGRIEWTGSIIAHPILVRDVRTDAPVDIRDQLAELGLDSVTMEMVSTESFHAYRAPTRPGIGEDGGRRLYVPVVRASQFHGLHETDLVRATALDRLRTLPVLADRVVAVRFGTPLLAAASSKDLDGAVPVGSFAPQTNVLGGPESMSEFDWLTPNANDWEFPANLSALDAEWGCWMREDIDIWLRIELRTPKQALPDPYPLTMIAEYRRTCFEASLFFAGPSAQCEQLCQRLGEGDLPTLRCAYGPGGELLAWLHPQVSWDSGGVIPNPERDGRPAPAGHDAVFAEMAERVRVEIADSIKPLSHQEAEQVLEIAGVNPLAASDVTSHHSAELVHFYEDIPSPVLYRERVIIFVSWWRVPAPLEEVREFFGTLEVGCSGTDEVYVDVKNAYRAKVPFPLVTFVFRGHPEESTQAVVDAVLANVVAAVEGLATTLTKRFPGAKLASREFWTTEVRAPPSVTFFE